MSQRRVVRPSMKPVWAAYAFAMIVILAAWFGYFAFLSDQSIWLLAAPLILLLPALGRHVRQRSVVLTLEGDHLTLESGLLAQTRRTLDMAKVQDVMVRQKLRQRLLGVGDLCLETAGETGGLGIAAIDNPRAVAEEILRVSRGESRAYGQRAT